MVHTFSNQWWVSVGGGYYGGGESRVSGEAKDDARSQILSGVSLGFPIGRIQALKLAYHYGDTLNDVGSSTNSFLVSWTIRF